MSSKVKVWCSELRSGDIVVEHNGTINCVISYDDIKDTLVFYGKFSSKEAVTLITLRNASNRFIRHYFSPKKIICAIQPRHKI